MDHHRNLLSFGKSHFLTDVAINLLHWELVCYIWDTWADADFYDIFLLNS